MMHVRLIPALTRTIYGSNLLKTFKIASPGYSNRATFRCFPGMSSKNSKSENKSKKEETISNDSLSSNKDSPPPWVTRSKVSIDIQSERERFLSMPLEEKRKLYKCGKKLKLLDDVPTWPDFYQQNENRLKKAVSKKKLPKLYPVNEEINKRVSIWKGDITTLEIDVIANAANKTLLGGGGVDGAIHSAAGKKLVQECLTLTGCETGEAKITAGYKLPAKYVIHTVGPIGEKEDLLSNAYSSVLGLLKENNLASVAIPCISTGIYGYPSEKAALVALKTVRDFLEKDDTYKKMDRVIFCLFMPKDVSIYEEQMQVYFPIEDAALTDDKGDVEMKNSEEKVDPKKISANDTKTKKEEKMDTEGKEEPKLGGEGKMKAENKEENMETEDREVKQDVKVDVDGEIGKESKEKAAITKEEKMDTSDGPVQGNKDKANKEADKNVPVNSVKSEDCHSKNRDSNGDKSSSKTEKQTTGKGKSGIVPKTEEKSNVEESVVETESKNENSIVTRRALRHAEPCDPNPKDMKQAKM
ncbi:ADP-ribose glycohydrolase MACROD2-like [Crassostrea angulata]|uniref:ADP-ribose glycohydrolase MACROD2-like n=1 Tax=Magallana angulata TaxID=2784310 RepID=UPI0022B0AAD2|nr:ADP-ribose glycohydrolase MACROD2-like [Crassostrea angulata]